MTTATLTPQTIQTPVVVNVAAELSGTVWVGRFLAQDTTAFLKPDFQLSVDRFISAMRAGGARVRISNTLRPKERAYLMHWAHKIYRNNVNPATAPSMPGVNIDWVHATLEQSVRAARNMVHGFVIQNLGANTPPALNTLHTIGEAINMSISWSGNLTVAKMDSTLVTIDTQPRTGMNLMLKP